MYYFLDRVNNNKTYKELLAAARDNKFIAVFGAQPNEKPFIVSGSRDFALYVCSDYVEAQRVYRTLSSICSGKVVYVPSKEDVLLYKRNVSKNVTFSRNRALSDILHGADCAVVCVDALLQFMPLRSRFFDDCFSIKKGVGYNTAELVKKLVGCGFVRVDSISAEGEFVMRGDILDVSMPFEKRFRVDFFDDEAETIKTVNADGTAAEEILQADIYPLYETVGYPSSKLQEIQKYIRRLKLSQNAQTRLNEIVADLSLRSEEHTSELQSR